VPATLSSPSPPRPAPEDAEAVLARLRQQGHGSQQVDASPPVESRPPPVVSAPRPRSSPLPPQLAAARAALAAGRMEDARRLLQQAQMQLVFRPVGAAGDDSSPAGKGAADVAQALEALSATNGALGRRYVDVAIADLSGSATSPPVEDAHAHSTGYAPAFPPR
jgi:hypothetical protein